MNSKKQKKRFRRKRPFILQRAEGGNNSHCSVPLCSAAGRFNRILSFHSFPKDPDLRSLWLRRIRRQFTIGTNSRVCSRHFESEDIYTAASGKRHLKKSAVPSLFHWNNFVTNSRRPGVWERRPLQTRSAVDEAGDDCAPAPIPVIEDHEYVKSPFILVDRSKFDHLCTEMEELGRQLQSQLLEQRFGLRRFASPPEVFCHFTRFTSYRHFQHFWRLIEPAVKSHMSSSEACAAAGSLSALHTTKLPFIDELLLFLMHLSVGLPPEDLAVRFGLAAPAVSRVISAWGHFLSQLLGGTCLWLPAELVKTLLPPEFETFSDTQVVLDCAEISCQRPSAALGHSEQCSMYKALVGMAPHGAVTFVSSLFPMTLSDCEVFKLSGITSVLQPHMAVMVLRGLLIDNVSPCRVHRPAGPPEHTQNQSQNQNQNQSQNQYQNQNQNQNQNQSQNYSRQSVEQTQAMVRLRVYVERCLRRVTDYKLFDRTAPAPVCGSIQELFHVACYLLNYQSTPLDHP